MCTNYFAIDFALQQAFDRQERRFNAYKVAFWSQQTDVAEVNRYLLQKVGTVLRARIEFICPKNHPTSSIQFGQKIPLEAECHVCREEFQPSLEESNIVFDFCDCMDHLKEQKKTKLVNTDHRTEKLSPYVML